MSFSCHTKKASKAEALAHVTAQVLEATRHQQAHQGDRAAVVGAVAAVVGSLPEPAETDLVEVSCHGHAGGDWQNGVCSVREITMSVTAKLVHTPHTA